MYPYMNEDAMFERLESLHREIESSRLMAHGLAGWGRLLRNLGARAWLLGGLAMRRPPRHHPAPTHHVYSDLRPARALHEDTAASDVA
jgi:hypothetical protein